MLYIRKYKIIPINFPCKQSGIPIPNATIRIPVMKNESPIPDKGPAKAVFIFDIFFVSNSSFFSFSSYIARIIPPTSGAN